MRWDKHVVQWIEQERLNLEDIHVISTLIVDGPHLANERIIHIVLNDDNQLVSRLVEDFLGFEDVLHIIIHIIRPDWLCYVVFYVYLLSRIQVIAFLEEDVELVIRIHRVQLMDAEIGEFRDFKPLTLQQVKQNVARQVESRNEWFCVGVRHFVSCILY
jgi:hypothetical protein